MPGAAAGLIGASILGSAAQSRAAASAGSDQSAAAAAGIAEQRRQFDEIQTLLRPYVEGGETALGAQMALAGLAGPEAQAAQIRMIEEGPEFQALIDQGEEAILQRASATGGLRGGNVQAALAQYRPNMLAARIGEQYGRYGGIAALGQASATGQAQIGQQTGSNIAGLLQQQGAAQAGASLAQGQAWGNALGGVAQVLGAQSTGILGGGGGIF
jgi:hypothetical protein